MQNKCQKSTTSSDATYLYIRFLNYVLYRSSGTWKNENELYEFSIFSLSDENKSPPDGKLFDESLHVLMSWIKHHDLRNQRCNEDVKIKYESPIGELQVQLPVILFLSMTGERI